MAEAMTRGMNSAQPLISRGKGCSVGYHFICLRHPLPAEGVHRYTEPVLESSGAASVVRVAMCDEDALNATPLCSLFYNGIKIGCIVNRGINDCCSFDAAPQYYGIGARSRHDRRIGGQDNCIWCWHCNLLQFSHVFGYFPWVAHILRQVDPGYTILPCQDRQTCNDVPGGGRFKGLFYAAESRQFAQLANSGKNEGKCSLLGARQSLGGCNPHTFACLQLIMRGLLFCRCGRNKEVGVKTFRHTLGRNPVGEIAQVIGCQPEFFNPCQFN